MDAHTVADSSYQELLVAAGCNELNELCCILKPDTLATLRILLNNFGLDRTLLLAKRACACNIPPPPAVVAPPAPPSPPNTVPATYPVPVPPPTPPAPPTPPTPPVPPTPPTPPTPPVPPPVSKICPPLPPVGSYGGG